jgi:uncharacterized protein YebE (UPF0316 family)
MNEWLLPIGFFVVGLLEMLFWSLQTKALIKDKLTNTFVFTFISVIIWYYVVENVASNISKWWLMLTYATGCSIGNIATIKLDSYIDKLARIRLWKRKRKKTRRPIKKK